MCLPSACGGQKRLFNPIDLKLQVTVNCHVGAKTPVLGPLEENFKLLTPEPFPKPMLGFFFFFPLCSGFLLVYCKSSRQNL